MYYYYRYKTKVGEYNFIEKDNNIVGLYREELKSGYEYVEKETELIKKTFSEVEEFLDGKRKEFTVNINPEGTEFQRLVWNELRNIPYGETRSYKEIAESIGRDKAYRAVGNANNKNPISLIVP